LASERIRCFDHAMTGIEVLGGGLDFDQDPGGFDEGTRDIAFVHDLLLATVQP
jgi:hypothetical protein